MSFDLKLHAYRLLMDEPFFAALSRKIEKRADYNILTAGVRVDPESAQFEMITTLTSLPACLKSMCVVFSSMSSTT